VLESTLKRLLLRQPSIMISRRNCDAKQFHKCFKTRHSFGKLSVTPKCDTRVQKCTESSYLLDHLVTKSSGRIAVQPRRSSEHFMIFRYYILGGRLELESAKLWFPTVYDVDYVSSISSAESRGS
jgi:hypothetical protein